MWPVRHRNPSLYCCNSSRREMQSDKGYFPSVTSTSAGEHLVRDSPIRRFSGGQPSTSRPAIRDAVTAIGKGVYGVRNEPGRLSVFCGTAKLSRQTKGLFHVTVHRNVPRTRR